MLLVAQTIAGSPLYVDPVQIYGPLFDDEATALRKTITTVLQKQGEKVVDASKWEALSEARKTRPDGPECALAPRVQDLVALRLDAKAVRPVFDLDDSGSGSIMFDGSEALYDVPIAGLDAEVWLTAVRAAEPVKRGRGGGARGFGMVGDPVHRRRMWSTRVSTRGGGVNARRGSLAPGSST